MVLCTVPATICHAASPSPGHVPVAPASEGGDVRPPIVSDSEFERSVPSLESNADSGGGIATAPTNPALPLPPPGAIDPAVEQPLAPLASFDVEPFDDSRYTEAADARSIEVRYRYRIDGLDNLDNRNTGTAVSPDEIRDRFRSASALQEGRGKAANAAMINARLGEDRQLLADILSGEGFFDATVAGLVEPPDKDGGNPLTVILDVTPGPRYRLGRIAFDAPAVTPPNLISEAFAPKPGEPIVAERILGAEANIAVHLPRNGYPFVRTGQRDILLDAESRTGDYTLPVVPGPRSSFGDIVVTGAKPVFQPAHIATIARFGRGQLYDSRKVDDLRAALVATGLFATVAVTPRPSGTPAGDGTEYANIEVEQQAGPPRTWAAQAGYATGEGFKIDGSWTHRNLFPPEGALVASLTAGTQEQGLGATFRRSNAGQRDRSVQIGLDARRSNYDAFEALTGRLSARVSVDSTPIWQKRWTYSYGAEILGTNEKAYDFAVGAERRRTYYLLALPGQVTFDRSNSLLDPTSGFRLSASLSPEVSLGSGTRGYVRTRLEGTAYYPVAENWVLAGRVRVGSIAGAAREDIAPSRRFYGGGGGSVRGFGYQQLGPKDPDANPVGGRSLVEAAGEVRYRFGNYGIVAFVDGGQVYASSLPSFTDWRLGVGVGARLYTNFGPMRLDIATPLGRRPGESRVTVYASIGQAF